MILSDRKHTQTRSRRYTRLIDVSFFYSSCTLVSHERNRHRFAVTQFRRVAYVSRKKALCSTPEVILWPLFFLFYYRGRWNFMRERSMETLISQCRTIGTSRKVATLFAMNERVTFATHPSCPAVEFARSQLTGRLILSILKCIIEIKALDSQCRFESQWQSSRWIYEKTEHCSADRTLFRFTWQDWYIGDAVMFDLAVHHAVYS